MTKARTAVIVGRSLCTLALLSLIGAWVTQLTGAPLLGEGQAHLFSDATVFALLGIASLLDGLIHLREAERSGSDRSAGT